jgi:plastocyanin
LRTPKVNRVRRLRVLILMRPASFITFLLALSALAPLWAERTAVAAPRDELGPGKRHTVTIQGLKFKPEKVEIEPGDTVVWVNKDDRDHTVVADDGSFESGRIRNGKSYEKKFTKPGKYNYGDDLHPRMRGVVVVKEKK